MESVINDVELLDLAVIPTDGGPVMHMMRPASPLFGEIGEVYFSEVADNWRSCTFCSLITFLLTE